MQGARRTSSRARAELLQRRAIVWVLAFGLALTTLGANLWIDGGGPATSAATTRAIPVNVTLSDFRIDSSLTTFLVGTTYRFIVRDAGDVNHEFMLIPPEDDLPPVQTTGQLYNYARAHIPVVEPGATKTIDYTFRPSDKEPLEMACYYPGEHDAGMQLSVTVL